MWLLASHTARCDGVRSSSQSLWVNVFAVSRFVKPRLMAVLMQRASGYIFSKCIYIYIFYACSQQGDVTSFVLNGQNNLQFFFFFTLDTE